MRQTVSTEILFPLITRAGTALMGWIVGRDVAQSEAEQIVLVVIAFCLVIFDLVTSHFVRKKAAK